MLLFLCEFVEWRSLPVLDVYLNLGIIDPEILKDFIFFGADQPFFVHRFFSSLTMSTAGATHLRQPASTLTVVLPKQEVPFIAYAHGPTG